MALPNFICIGAPKCGTTTLYDILKTHPEIYLSSFKEPHFFNVPENYQKGIAYYEKEYFSLVKNEKSIGEFTPSYLFDPEVPKRIFNDLAKDVKFIIILRNPLDRAYSHYRHTKRDGFEELAFEEALKSEEARLNTNNYYFKLKYSYCSQGMYAQHIQEYLKYFDRKQFKVILFEEFVANQQKVVDEVLDFLGVQHTCLDVNIKSNPARAIRFKWVSQIMASKGVVKKIIKSFFPSKGLRQKLRTFIMESNTKEAGVVERLTSDEKVRITKQYFEKGIQDLEVVIGKRLTSWK